MLLQVQVFRFGCGCAALRCIADCQSAQGGEGTRLWERTANVVSPTHLTQVGSLRNSRLGSLRYCVGCAPLVPAAPDCEVELVPKTLHRASLSETLSETSSNSGDF